MHYKDRMILLLLKRNKQAIQQNDVIYIKNWQWMRLIHNSKLKYMRGNSENIWKEIVK